jgi:hypothetical protein
VAIDLRQLMAVDHQCRVERIGDRPPTSPKGPNICRQADPFDLPHGLGSPEDGARAWAFRRDTRLAREFAGRTI